MLICIGLCLELNRAGEGLAVYLYRFVFFELNRARFVCAVNHSPSTVL